DVIIGMNRRLAPQRRAGNLATPIGDPLIHIHIELSAAAGHPYVQREHVVMLARKNLVADLHDQIVAFLFEPFARVVGVGGGFLQGGVGSDHFTRNQILADAEVLQRALGLRAPQLVSRNIYFAKAIGFLTNVRHIVVSFLYPSVRWPSSYREPPSEFSSNPLRTFARCLPRSCALPLGKALDCARFFQIAPHLS